jgi:hypothetical protein
VASRSEIAKRHGAALTEVGEILARRDPDVGERLRGANHNLGVPSPIKSPGETAAYHAECMASLARIVDKQLSPKKRGRPPKTQ